MQHGESYATFELLLFWLGHAINLSIPDFVCSWCQSQRTGSHISMWLIAPTIKTSWIILALCFISGGITIRPEPSTLQSSALAHTLSISMISDKGAPCGLLLNLVARDLNSSLGYKQRTLPGIRT